MGPKDTYEPCLSIEACIPYLELPFYFLGHYDFYTGLLMLIVMSKPVINSFGQLRSSRRELCVDGAAGNSKMNEPLNVTRESRGLDPTDHLIRTSCMFL